MRARAAGGWIDQPARGAEAGIEGQIVGIVIGIGPVLRGAAEIVGRDQTVQAVIAIGPGAGRIRRVNAEDGPRGIACVGQVQQRLAVLLGEDPREEAAPVIVTEAGGDPAAIGDGGGLATRIVADAGYELCGLTGRRCIGVADAEEPASVTSSKTPSKLHVSYLI